MSKINPLLNFVNLRHFPSRPPVHFSNMFPFRHFLLLAKRAVRVTNSVSVITTQLRVRQFFEKHVYADIYSLQLRMS